VTPPALDAYTAHSSRTHRHETDNKGVCSNRVVYWVV